MNPLVGRTIFSWVPIMLAVIALIGAGCSGGTNSPDDAGTDAGADAGEDAGEDGGQDKCRTNSDCDDGNSCTTDYCNEQTSCVNDFNTDPCSDDDVCTVNDTCANGECVPGSARDCDDGNVCTNDSCDPDTGCESAFNTADCDDQDACSMDDACSGGQCQGVPLDADGDGQYADGCYGGTDCCDSGTESVPGCTAATAGQINRDKFEGLSAAGTCSDGLDNDCDGQADGADLGCKACNDDSDCSDNDRCTGIEICAGNVCQPGDPLDCDDDEICTTDSCDPATGCQHADNSRSCDDGNECTVDDQCAGGTCQPGDPRNCDDWNDCTDDSCQADVGCVNPPNNANSCNDGDACTENDYCSDGECLGLGVSCNDDNPCTFNQCDPQEGCVYPSDDTAACVHPDPCIVNDNCSNGHCVGDPQDVDEDNYGDEACGGDDCDDNDDQTYPGAPEICGDGKDNNCNYLADEGCDTCGAVDPAAELRIDNDEFGGGNGLDTDDEVINVFFVETTAYTVFQVEAAFLDFDCNSGGDSGQYSVHIYADDAGVPGQELGSGNTETVNRAGGCDPETDPQEIAWNIFELSSPVTFTQGQLFWVALRTHQQEMDDQGQGDQFIPIFSPPVLVPYPGGFLMDASESQLYSVSGNWLMRVQGCGVGPRLELTAHSPGSANPGSDTQIDTTLHNRGFAGAAGVSGVLSCDEPEMVIVTDTADYGSIDPGASASNNPAFVVRPAATAFGIYGMSLDISYGTSTRNRAFGLYVQGSGCTQDNHGLTADNGTATYVVPLAANDMLGNYFVVDSTSFTMTGLEVGMYKTVANPPSANFRVKVYSYLGGAPDQLLATSDWQSIAAGDGGIIAPPPVLGLNTPLTLKEGDSFFAFIESQSDLSGYEFFAPLADNGSGQDSWRNGVIWDQSENKWIPYGVSGLIHPRGCQATELSYDSHTTSPAGVNPGDTVSLTITLVNDGAENATNVVATLDSSDPDVTVGSATGNYGTINAGQTKAAGGFQVTVASNADEFQYMLPLSITDGVNTWDDLVPLRLVGGVVDLTFSEFTTNLVGNDIHYHYVVSNQGNVDCITPFQVDVYIDEESPPSAGQQSNEWNETVDRLDLGQSRTFDLVLSDADPGEYTAYVQCDTLQAVVESDEGNNVDGPSSQTVGTTDVFELLNPARKWFPQDMDVEFRFVSGNSQPGLTQTEARDAVRNGFQYWEDVPTATIAFQEIPQASGGGFDTWDGYNTMTFDDPDGDLGTGTLAANIPVYTSSQSMVTNGVTFYRMTDADIVFNNGIPYGTNAEAASPSCWSSPVTDIEGVATHEIGHLLGLDHPDVQDATMYYAIGQCDPSSVTLEISDINGVTFIYPQ